MGRPAACVACRQNKLRCNAASKFPAPCSRCANRHVACRVDMDYKRVRTRHRVEQLTQELHRLKSGLHMTPDGTANQTPAVMQASPTSWVQCEPPAMSSYHSGTMHPDPLDPNAKSGFKLSDVVLSSSEGAQLFSNYFLHYHHHLPVLDPTITPKSTFQESPLLFWTIIAVASRAAPEHKRLFKVLRIEIPRLLGTLMTVHRDSIHPMQAALLLSTWPLPVRRQSDDMRWTYSGLVLHMALQAGCHRVGYEHEYHSYAYSKRPADERRHTRIWRCWCFVNALLSCELGLPSLVPFDALDIQPADEAALPPAFLAKLRIALYVCRINETLGDAASRDGRHRIRMLRLLEKDLRATADVSRGTPQVWDSTVEYVHLCVLLNLYSSCLRRVPIASLNDPDYKMIQGSAAQAACDLVDLFAGPRQPTTTTTTTTADASPPPNVNSNNTLLRQEQKYHPKFQIKFNAIALLMLLKISSMNQISMQQLAEVDDAIRRGHGALMACSASEGDEAHRSAAVVEILCKRGVIASAREGDSPVESRLGASMWLELVATAIRWRRQNADMSPKPREDGGGEAGQNQQQRDESGVVDQLQRAGLSVPGATMEDSRATGQGGLVGATLDDVQALHFDRMGDLEAQQAIDAFNADDWMAYMDVAQTDFGMGYHTGWWGGIDSMER